MTSPPEQRPAPVTIADVLGGRRAPHELPPPFHDLWRDGFHAGAARVQGRVAREAAAADYWYFVANNPDDVRRESQARLAAFNMAMARTDAGSRWAALDRIAANAARAAQR